LLIVADIFNDPLTFLRNTFSNISAAMRAGSLSGSSSYVSYLLCFVRIKISNIFFT